MKRSVLLVIDIQSRTIPLLIGKKAFLQRINHLISFYNSNNLPILFIQQLGMGGVHKNLNFSESDNLLSKNLPSAFSSTEFCKKLEELHPDELVITGLMSQACVQATASSALNKGYAVTLVEDAHDSILKPFRSIINKQLSNKGAILMSTDTIINKKW